MDNRLRTQAESRLESAALELGLIDPRPAYRDRLRMLREIDAGAFANAIDHYETVVLPALAEGDAMTEWISYGRFLAGLSGGDPQLSVIDATGRAREFQAPLPSACLALFIPADATVPVLPAAIPAEPSAAQQAALALLTA